MVIFKEVNLLRNELRHLNQGQILKCISRILPTEIGLQFRRRISTCRRRLTQINDRRDVKCTKARID